MLVCSIPAVAVLDALQCEYSPDTLYAVHHQLQNLKDHLIVCCFV